MADHTPTPEGTITGDEEHYPLRRIQSADAILVRTGNEWNPLEEEEYISDGDAQITENMWANTAASSTMVPSPTPSPAVQPALQDPTRPGPPENAPTEPAAMRKARNQVLSHAGTLRSPGYFLVLTGAPSDVRYDQTITYHNGPTIPPPLNATLYTVSPASGTTNPFDSTSGVQNDLSLSGQSKTTVNSDPQFLSTQHSTAIDSPYAIPFQLLLIMQGELREAKTNTYAVRAYIHRFCKLTFHNSFECRGQTWSTYTSLEMGLGQNLA